MTSSADHLQSGDLVTVLGTGATFLYFPTKETHPPARQMAFYMDKKTIVILGSGYFGGWVGCYEYVEEHGHRRLQRRRRQPAELLPLHSLASLSRNRNARSRSIIQSPRYVARHKARRVSIYEAEALKVDPHSKQFTIADLSDIKGDVNNMTVPYDILVYAAGAETQTIGIPSVKEGRVDF